MLLGKRDRQSSVSPIMDFEEYCRLRGETFVQYYRCQPMSRLNKENVEDGNRIIMPPSALDILGSLRIEWPMQFQIQNPLTLQFTHCGVLEFVAEEGFVHLPSWLMERLGLEENDPVLMKTANLPKATFIKMQPHTKDFLDISDPKAVLEHNLGKFTSLTTGDTILITDGAKKHRLNVVKTGPDEAVSVVETDCEVDFEPPLDYREPIKEIISQGAQCCKHDISSAPPQPARFAGVGKRLDGKPVEQPPSTSSPAAGQLGTNAAKDSASGRPQRGLLFRRAATADGSSGQQGSKKEEEEQDTNGRLFSGKKYSLQ